MKPTAFYVSSSPCLLPPSEPALIFTPWYNAGSLGEPTRKLVVKKYNTVWLTAKARCYLNTLLISQIIKLHTGTSVVVNMWNGGLLVRKATTTKWVKLDFEFPEFQDVICSKSETMRVSLLFINQMSLQLGHRWVFLKHQKQMGRKTTNKHVEVALRSQQESILQTVGFTIKYFNHIGDTFIGEVWWNFWKADRLSYRAWYKPWWVSA